MLASGAIKRGPAAFLKHLGALGDMMERSLALIDSDIQGPEPVQQLGSAYRRRMRQAALEFPRSAAEFFCAYSYADISAAKGNTFLQMATNPKFSPHDLSEFTSVQTMESKIIDSSQSEREFRNLAAPQFPENRGATIIIEFKHFKIKTI